MQYIFRLSAIRSGQWWLTMEKRLEWTRIIIMYFIVQVHFFVVEQMNKIWLFKCRAYLMRNYYTHSLYFVV